MITVIATSCDKCFQVAISIATIVDIDFHQTFSKIRSHLNKFKNKIYKSDLMMKYIITKMREHERVYTNS